MHQESASMILTQFSFHVQYPIPVFEASMAVSFLMDPENVFFFGWFLLKPSQKGQMTDPNGVRPARPFFTTPLAALSAAYLTWMVMEKQPGAQCKCRCKGSLFQNTPKPPEMR